MVLSLILAPIAITVMLAGCYSSCKYSGNQVHISNISARESFRNLSVIAPGYVLDRSVGLVYMAID